MKILVTGGAGFIGSHMVDKLVSLKHKVVVIDDLSTGKKENLNQKARFYKVKVQDRKVEEIFRKERPQAIFHLAAQIDVRYSVKDPVFDAQTNILGTINLLESCVKQKIKKFIFISTGGAIYGDGAKVPTPESALEAPVSPYGIAKLSVSKYLHFYQVQYGLSYVDLRLANIYGPRQDSKGEAGVTAIFCGRLKENKFLLVNGSGKQTRDYVYVKDVVDAAVRAFRSSKVGCYNVGTGKETSVNQLAENLVKVSGRDVQIKHKAAVKGEQMRSCLSSNKIRRELGWKPKYDLKKGLEETWEWFRDN